jgi:hypothetical protein
MDENFGFQGIDTILAGKIKKGLEDSKNENVMNEEELEDKIKSWVNFDKHQ